jgi:hypothetical protein
MLPRVRQPADLAVTARGIKFGTLPREMRTCSFLMICAALTLAACADNTDQARADSELARDLALVNQAPANPEFRDVPLSEATRPAPTTKAPAPATRARTTAPWRAPTPAPVVTRPRPVEPEPAPVVEQPAPQPRFRGIREGTSFALSTGSRVCTNNLPGDKIVATVTSAVIGEDGAVIPVGTTVVLEVAEVRPGDSPESARIGLRVRSVLLNDEPHNVDGNVAVLSELERSERPRDGSSDKKKVIGGAVAGAILGQIMGRDTKSTVIGAAAGAAAGTAAAAATRKYDACLPSGANVRVTTTQPISLG